MATLFLVLKPHIIAILIVCFSKKYIFVFSLSKVKPLLLWSRIPQKQPFDNCLPLPKK